MGITSRNIVTLEKTSTSVKAQYGKCMNKIYKTFVCNFIIGIVFLSGFFLTACISQPPLKGGINIVIQKGYELELNFSTPINFYYSQTGDKVAGFIKKGIALGNDFVIPAGSRVEGIITEVKKPKNFGQDGAFHIDINEIVTPENISIPVYGSISTETSSKSEKVAEILSYDAALIAFGSLNGFIGSIQYGGIPLAIASHGISLLAGTGVGAGAGIIGSVARKGKIPTAITGQPMKVSLNTDLYILGDLPKIRDQKSEIRNQKNEYKGFRFFESVKKEDIDLTIKKINKNHSETYGDYITLDFVLKNNSKNIISLSDFALTDESSSEQIHPDLLLSGTEALKRVDSSHELTTSLSFIIREKEIKNYYLALIDPLDRGVIIKVALNKPENK